MANITKALLIVLSINVVFFLAQVSMFEINPDGTRFYNCEGNILSEFELNRCQGDFYLIDSTQVGNLPQSESAVSPEQGNIFTDIFNTAKNWLLSSTGVSYLVGVITAPTSFLTAIGLPAAFVFGIGALWYGMTFFLFIAWLFGRDS